jgi:hypothetical protein
MRAVSQWSQREGECMAIYKYSIKPDASDDERRLTLKAGPFLVEASDEAIGGQLLSLNFGDAMSRLIKAANSLSVWGNSRASECVPLAEVQNPEELRQKREVLGVDIAAWFLVRPELLETDGRYARMVWWPLGSQDRCPV